MTNLDKELQEVEQALRSATFDIALGKVQAILAGSPGHPAATRLFGAALRGCGRHVEANTVLTALAARMPNDALVQNSLGAARRSLGDIDGAREAFERACTLAPELPAVWFNFAITLFMQDEVRAGMEAIERVIALAPTMTQARMIKAEMLREQGRTKQVTAEYRAVIAVSPNSPWPWFGLSNLKNVPMTAADVNGIRRALQAHPQSGDGRTALQFAFSKALEDNQRYEEALQVLDDANAEVRERVRWDAALSSVRLDNVLAAFNPAPAHADAALGEEVIFIVSLPRSGSTLVEQILASHSQVEGAGEHDYANNVIEEEERRRGSSIPAWAREASPADWRRLGERYLEITADNRLHKPRFTDKALPNWRVVGALLAMLPAARVIVCRRDPLETCFSCYRQWFSQDPHHYAYAIDDLAEYWRDFDRACNVWKSLHPDRVYDLVHEDLIADQETQTRKLLDFCGLEFESRCLNFHTTERKITTISAAQVREPLRRDTAHAPAYGSLLNPLRLALGLEPLQPLSIERRRHGR